MDSASSERRLAVGTIVASRLRIVRCLGAGGMGVVYEVEHEITRHRRALKLLHASLAQVPSVVERFLREASVAGRIGNPHIVETFDAGRLETGEPYIVMELLKGETLAERLDRSGPLQTDIARHILAQACRGVDAAHAMGIIHRDLKPENLFLTGTEDNFVKILDFGISKFDTTTGVAGLTLDGSPMGTPYYMSPEQVRGDATIDARTDVYALGVVLYECLTGRKPFVADTLPRLIVLIHEGRFTAPSEIRPELPKEWDTIVAQAMAMDRGCRFPSASSLSEALHRTGQSISPVTITGSQRPAPDVLLAPSGASPALTPDVFSKPFELERAHKPEQASSSRNRKRRFAIGIATGVGALGIAALLYRLNHSPQVEFAPEAKFSMSAAPGALSSRGPDTETTFAGPSHQLDAAAASMAVKVDIAPPAASLSSVSAAKAAQPSSVALSAIRALPHPTIASSSAHSNTTPGSNAPAPNPIDQSKTRAAKYGLSESNPF